MTTKLSIVHSESKKFGLDKSEIIEKGLDYTTDKEFRNRYNEFFERLNENRDKDNTIKPHSPHSTRHTYITLRLVDGDSKWAVMEMAGHSELRVTLKYTHMSNFDVLKHALEQSESNKNAHYEKDIALILSELKELKEKMKLAA
ncbi:hypothetical protein AGMMS49975_29260 [Clostridia bacterium]|nr:hypothetical protein AGMMS49975_29260 [Clostridia bacterium]